MARLEDLIDQIGDGGLRRAIEQEVRDLKRRQRFGIVFERHIPEVVSLHEYPIEAGLLVRPRLDPKAASMRVVSVNGGVVTVEEMSTGDVRDVPISDLDVVKRLDEPVYPYLERLGEVRGA